MWHAHFCTFNQQQQATNIEFDLNTNSKVKNQKIFKVVKEVYVDEDRDDIPIP